MLFETNVSTNLKPRSFRARDQDFDLRLQDWLDDHMNEQERDAFEQVLAGQPEKATIARQMVRIDERLKRLNEGVLNEKVPTRLLMAVKRTARDIGGAPD